MFSTPHKSQGNSALATMNKRIYARKEGIMDLVEQYKEQCEALGQGIIARDEQIVMLEDIVSELKEQVTSEKESSARLSRTLIIIQKRMNDYLNETIRLECRIADLLERSAK